MCPTQQAPDRISVRRWLLATASLLLLGQATPLPASQPHELRVHLFVTGSGAPAQVSSSEVAPSILDWLDGEIAIANSRFAPVGLSFHRPWYFLRIRSSQLHMDAPSDARAFRADADDRHGVDVFLVDDIHASSDVAGRAWVVAPQTREACIRSYCASGFIVIVADPSQPALLTHALGHYFGLWDSVQAGNPMFGPAPGGGAFAEDQLATILDTASILRERAIYQ